MTILHKKYLDKIKNIVFESTIIESSKIFFSENVVKACEMNQCGLYGKRWTCPPAVGTISEIKCKCLKFKYALVFTTKNEIEDSFDIEGMFTAKKNHDKIQEEVFNKLNFRNCILLGAGGCNICKKCTYPDTPCRFPDKAISAVEAYAINVLDLAEKCGIKYNNGINTVTYYSLILFGENNGI